MNITIATIAYSVVQYMFQKRWVTLIRILSLFAFGCKPKKLRLSLPTWTGCGVRTLFSRYRAEARQPDLHYQLNTLTCDAGGFPF
jgi:hypothetical protein